MVKDKKVAVIAGTPVDTKMGAEFIEKASGEYEIYMYPVSQNPQQQTAFQISSEDEKEKKLGEIIEDAKSKGINSFFVYCNSLSGAVNFDKLSVKHGVHIVTPLKAYSEVAKRCKRIGVMAANNQSLAGIEVAAMSGNYDIEVIGVSLLPVVKQIEEQKKPEKIVADWNLDRLIDFFENAEVENIILGCTHFPWFEAEFTKHAHVPVVDPGAYMMNLLEEI